VSAGEEKRLLTIPLSSIRTNPYQPRRYFDPNALNELKESILQLGVLQPISVRHLGDLNYELVAGERRFRAAKEAGLTAIPALVTNVGDDTSAIIALVENLQRQDLSFFEEADAYARFIELHGFTQEELARKLSKSQSAIANKLRLLRLSPDMKRMITANNLTERHARALLRLPDEEMRLAALKQVCKNQMTVQRTENLVETMLARCAEKEEKAKVSRPKIRSEQRLFLNTVNEAVKLMKRNGMKIRVDRQEDERQYTCVIRLSKA